MVPGNPFFHRGPIRDRSYFFGRAPLLTRALAFLAEGQSVALVGPRRIGKTSLLFHLADAAASPLRCAYLDCESWGQASAAQLYGRLARMLQQAMTATPVAAALHDESAPAAFATLERVVAQATQQGLQLALLLDEFEALSANPHLDNDFFASLRALAMEQRLAYVTVSTRPLLDLTYARVRARSSPFFNFFALLRIGLFARSESSALLRELSARGDVPFTPPFIDALITVAGDHPFFLQMLGDYAFDAVAAGAPQTAASAAALLHGPFREEASDHWGAFWANLEAADQRLLALLPVLAPIQPAGLRRLEAAGLVARTTTGAPTLLSDGFRAFVATQAVAGLVQAPPLTLDPALRRGQPLPLTPQQFDLLAYLVTHQARLVPKTELAGAIWPRADVANGLDSLRTTLKALRLALKEDAGCLANLRGQGYQFVPRDLDAASWDST